MNQPHPSHRAPRPALAAVAATLSTLFAVWAVPTLADDTPVDAKPVPIAIVDTLNQLSGGPHAGYRANHAKGVLATGTFAPAPGARSFSVAPHFSTEVPVVVRFSNGTGVPNLPDANPAASPHGMAIRFSLPDGTSTDIVAISANGFPVATPEEFLGLLQAVATSGPDAKKPTPIEQFLGSHPAALGFVTTPRPAPVSFATLAFFGVNAFKFTGSGGETRFARYQILPVAGEKALGDAEAAKAAPDYLMQELPARIGTGPVKFRLQAQVALPGDVTNDPTVVWPAGRELVTLGTLTLSGAPDEQVQAQKALLFNPLSLPAGIEPSGDPVLLIRPAAYAVSFGQRAQ